MKLLLILAALVIIGTPSYFLYLERTKPDPVRARFEAVCTKLGGTVVHDGRQWQCLK